MNNEIKAGQILANESPVAQALSKLDGQLDHLSNVISKHDSALSTCLRGNAPGVGSSGSEPKAIPASELVDRIERALQKVTSACHDIEELTSRVTL